MRAITRKVLGGAAVLAVMTGVVLVASLDGVDHRPYFKQAYYKETRNRLSALDTNSIGWGEVYVGFGLALLTPTINAPVDDAASGKFRALPLAGYGDREGRPAKGVHDDLHAKAAAFKVGDQMAVMIAADALIIPVEVAELALDQLGKELKLGRSQAYFGATHTHCSIGGWGDGIVAEAFAGEFQPGAREWFAGRLVAAARQAVADLKPAEVGVGSFTAPDFIRNRLVGRLGRVDPEFSYILVRQRGGTAGVIGSYGAHATVLSGSVMEFSGDYPGFWQREIESAISGTAIFFAGGVGSHSPVPPEKGFAGAERMGKALARANLEDIGMVALTNQISFGVVGLDVSLPPLNVRLTEDVRLRPWVARKLVPARPHTHVQALRIGESVWISTPCDFSGELALDIKDNLAACGAEAVITSFNGDYIGYVIPSRYYRVGGYEPQIMSFFGPAVPDYLEETIRELSMMVLRAPGNAAR